MMDPSEINNFEDQWKEAFKDASETPPPSVWEKIEAHLDREDDIVPLWWRSPKKWYAAASILVLMALGGKYLMDEMNPSIVPATPKEMASKAPTAKLEVSEPTTVLRNENADDVTAGEKKIAPTNEVIASVESEKNENSGVIKRNQPQIADSKGAGRSTNLTEKAGIPNHVEGEIVPAKAQIASAQVLKEKSTTSDNISEGEKKASETRMAAIPASTKEVVDENAVARDPFQVNALTPLAYSPLDVYIQKRIVFFKPQIIENEEVVIPKKSKEYWAGVGIMPASFNPNVRINSAPSNFAMVSNARQASTTGSSKAGNSVAFQTQGGLQLSKYWSLEMGVSYLQGNSKYEGGGYILDAISVKSSNVLESAVMGLANKNQAIYQPQYDNMSYNSMYINVNTTVNNNYQFVQLPVQAGFTLNSDKKLSYSLLGGVMANFFLSNEIESSSRQTVTTTASDDVYKTNNWAATTGLRFNYRVSSKWKATLSGTYQKALSSGFKDNQSMESHPYLYGVSWGMRYSF